MMVRHIEIRDRLDIYTPDELALALGVTTTTLAAWRSAGTGPHATKLGKSVFYRASDVVDWIDESAGDARAASDLLVDDLDFSEDDIESLGSYDGEEDGQEAESDAAAGRAEASGGGSTSNT